MDFCYFDYESSDSRVDFGQVLEFSFVHTDKNLKLFFFENLGRAPRPPDRGHVPDPAEPLGATEAHGCVPGGSPTQHRRPPGSS